MTDLESLAGDPDNPPMANRFRGFLPVVIDVETGGFDAENNALLEIAAVVLAMDKDGQLIVSESHSCNIEPHPDTTCEESSLEFTGINPDDPRREALCEADALKKIFQAVRKTIRENGCNRAILVAHNAHFDLSFVNAAVKRSDIKRNPFHPFSCFDTATLAGLAFGQTVLAKACLAADIPFNNNKAHHAAYDAGRTAMLFCDIVNRWQDMGGWRNQNSS
jgi:ribonuclease T